MANKTAVVRMGKYAVTKVAGDKPIVSVPDAAKRLGLSPPTVRKSVQHLEQIRILREMTGRQRGRVFVYDAYLNILSKGTDPLPR